MGIGPFLLKLECGYVMCNRCSDAYARQCVRYFSYSFPVCVCVLYPVPWTALHSLVCIIFHRKSSLVLSHCPTVIFLFFSTWRTRTYWFTTLCFHVKSKDTNRWNDKITTTRPKHVQFTFGGTFIQIFTPLFDWRCPCPNKTLSQRIWAASSPFTTEPLKGHSDGKIKKEMGWNFYFNSSVLLQNFCIRFKTFALS